MQQGQERGKRKQETGHLTVGDRRRQWCTRPIRNAGSHAIGRLQQQIREWYVSVLGQSQDNFIILHTFWRKHNLVLLPMQHRITGLNVISSLLWQSKFYNRMPTGGTWSEKEQQTKLRKGIRSLPQTCRIFLGVWVHLYVRNDCTHSILCADQLWQHGNCRCLSSTPAAAQ